MKFRFCIFITLCIIWFSESKLTIHDSNSNTTYDMKIYNCYPWDVNPILNKNELIFSNSYDMPIIRVDQPFQSFDPCDDSTFNPQDIDPLLEHHKLSQNSNGTVSYEHGWVALIERYTLPLSCEGIIPLHLLYSTYAALSAQKLGASGFIYLLTATFEGKGEGGVSGAFVGVVPPEVDLMRKQVKSEDVNIPALVGESLQYMDNNDLLLEISSPKFHWLIPSVSSPLFGHQEYDWNPFATIIGFKAEVFQIAMFTIGVASFTLGVFILKFTTEVFVYYKDELRDNNNIQNTDKGAGSRAALRMRLLILLPELINSFVRMGVCIDPFGTNLIFFYFTARILAVLLNSLSLFTDISTSIYCYDVYRIFKASRLMRTEKALILKYKYGLTFILIFVSFMIVLEVGLHYLSMQGRLGGNIVQLPALYVMIVTAICIAIFLKISSLMKSEMRLARNQLLGVSATSTSSSIGFKGSIVNRSMKHRTRMQLSPTLEKEEVTKTCNIAIGVHTDRNKFVLGKINNLMQLRVYIQRAAISRVLFTSGLLSFGSGLVFYHPFYMGFTLIFMVFFSLLTSYFQIMAAHQLPSKSSTNPTIIPFNSGDSNKK